MAVTKLEAKDFNTRSELEKYVASKYGLTTDDKPDVLVTGTKEELNKLHLGHGSLYYGIKVEETNFVKPLETKKVNRGKRVKPKKLGKADIKKSEE